MLGIKKLDIFIVKQFGLLFIGAFCICQFVLMMQFLWRYIDDLIGKGLTLDVLAQYFWWMALMLMPQAFPLALLLSSLITYGNLGETSELTAIKAAGISLMQAFRGPMVLSILITIASFLFQNFVTPRSNMEFERLLVSMKQKSPELEIPEGVFYDGIPNTNLYVQRKDLTTGMLYGIMIYRMTDSYDDKAIILADSGQLMATEEKKHLVLHLYDGAWHENMRSQSLAGNAQVPYRRETFTFKNIVLDFDGTFNLADGDIFRNNAQAKSLKQLQWGLDSLNEYYDSLGHTYYTAAMASTYKIPDTGKKDSLKALEMVATKKVIADSVLERLLYEPTRKTMNTAHTQTVMATNDLEFKSIMTGDGDRLIRKHKIEMWNKFTLSLSCLIFFFIGAPLGAIIRKGGLGVPVIISVLVFIFYYILDNTGFRMARGGMWAIWFGKTISTAVLAPLAIFVTYKATNDSMVFNADAYRNFFIKLFGIRQHRHIYRKEVIINDPDYHGDKVQLMKITDEISAYSKQHKLYKLPNIIDVFFRYRPDHDIEDISERMETTIEDLANTTNRVILQNLNKYPILAVKAHTRPFEYKWANIVAAIIIPVGAFLYIRMWRYRLQLYRDLKIVKTTNDAIVEEIEKINS